MTKGYVQVYTGNGKGKTTAAIGLLVRAVGAGLRVYMGQFLKRGEFSEVRALRERFPEVTIEQYGSGGLVKGKPSEEDRRLAAQGLARLRQAMAGGRYDLVIADEANVAVAAGLVTIEDLLAAVREKPEAVELVLTGRKAHPRLVKAADLVTEMKALKHYYARHVPARPGIEK